MFRKIFIGAIVLGLLSLVTLDRVYASPGGQVLEDPDSFDLLIETLTDANEKDLLADYLSDLLADWFIESLIVPRTGETPDEAKVRLSNRSDPFQLLTAVLTDANERDLLPEDLSDSLSDWFIENLIAPHTGETPKQARERLSIQAALPDHVKLEIGPDVKPEHIQDSVEGVRLMHEYALSVGLPDIEFDVEIYLYDDVDELCAIYSRLSGRPRTCKEGLAVAGTGYVVLDPSGRGGRLNKIMAHELFHTYQHGFSELSVGSGVSEVPEAGPRWLAEGIAEYYAYRAMDAGGILDYERERDSTDPWGFVEHGKYVDKSLNNLETWTDITEARGSTYSLFLLAAELLASYAGERALIDYYVLLQPGTTWQQAFESAFGMTVEEFYVLFEAHRSAGFPEVDISESVDTPTPPQTLDDYIVWKIGAEVSPAAKAEARATVQAVHNFAVSSGMPSIDRPMTIFLYHDLDSLVAEFQPTVRWDLTEQWFWTRFTDGIRMGVAGEDWIIVVPSTKRYQESSPETRERQLSEDVFYVYRNVLTGIWQGTPEDEVSPYGPTWLDIGSRRFLTYQALRPVVPEDCDLTRSRFARTSGSGHPPLSAVQTPGDFRALENAYGYVFVAVELLVAQAGPEAIFDYYVSLRTENTWQQAFESAFGMTVEEFYQLFDERRSAGFLGPILPMLIPEQFSDLLQDPSLPSYIRWDVGNEVERVDVESAIRGVKLMHEFAQSLGLPDPASPITVTIYKDMEKMACRYSTATGWDLELSRKYWENGGGVAGYGSVHVSGSSAERLKSDPHRLMRTMAHELTHAHFQTGLTGFSDHRSGMSPRWLGEGTANLVMTLLLLEDYPDALDQGFNSRVEEISRANSSGLQLRDAEVWPPSEGGSVGLDEAGSNIVSCIYSCGYLAAELLASRVGLNKLFDYYKHVEAWMEPWDYAGNEENPRREWRIAFERAYGMMLGEFYDLFEAHRAAGFPEVDIPKFVDR